MAAIHQLPPPLKRLTAANSGPADGAESPRQKKPRPPDPEAVDDAERAAAGDPEGTWTPGGGETDDSAPVEQTEPDTINLPKCPDAERIFAQHEENPEIPLCPSIDAGHRCHKEGGPDGCPLWDRPKAEEPAPKMDVNPPRRTRKKREE